MATYWNLIYNLEIFENINFFLVISEPKKRLFFWCGFEHENLYLAKICRKGKHWF
jgi:hypothetical protein